MHTNISLSYAKHVSNRSSDSFLFLLLFLIVSGTGFLLMVNTLLKYSGEKKAEWNEWYPNIWNQDGENKPCAFWFKSLKNVVSDVLYIPRSVNSNKYAIICDDCMNNI